MSEESTTPDLVELTRRTVSSGDVDTLMSFLAPDAVWESAGLGTSFEGIAEIRGFLEDWRGPFEELRFEVEEVLDLGNGVVFAVVIQTGRLHGSSGEVRLRYVTVAVWVEGLIVRVTNYYDIDEGRAAAERLAESRE